MGHYRELADCAACAKNDHEECTPLIAHQVRSTKPRVFHTVCLCFATHPDSEAHENALFWWTQDGNQPAALMFDNQMAVGEPVDITSRLRREPGGRPDWVKSEEERPRP